MSKKQSKPTINLDQLRDISEGDPDEMRRLARLYITSMQNHLRDIQQAFVSKNTYQMEYVAHTAAGASNMIGLTATASALKDLEGLAGNHDLNSAVALMPKIQRTFSATCAALDSELHMGGDFKRATASLSGAAGLDSMVPPAEMQ